MASTQTLFATVRRSPLARLVAQAVVAAIGLAIGAVAGLVGAFGLGLIAIPC